MSLESVEEQGKKADELWNKIYGEKKPEPKPEEGPKEEPKPEDFKHKYEVLQGKYNSEVPGLAYQVAELTKHVTKLQGELEEAKKPIEEPEPEKKPGGEDSVLRMFKEDYPEIYQGTNSLVDTLIKDRLSTVDRRIEEKIGGVEEKANREKYLSKLDADPEVGKEWRQLNQDPGFIGSLKEIESYTGRKKYDLLMDSWNQMDADRTLRFFKNFKTPQKTVEFENKKDGSTVTLDDWKKFTKDVVDGKWRGHEIEAQKEEERLLKALMKK